MRDVSDRSADGFSLIEVIVATGILATGLLSLAGVFSIGMIHMAASSPGIIAREKAREAVESVHTARDTGNVPWTKSGTSPGSGGVSHRPAALVHARVSMAWRTRPTTTTTAGLEKLPGFDNLLGTADDIPLRDYTREIQITDLFDGLRTDPPIVNPNLRQITRHRQVQGGRVLAHLYADDIHLLILMTNTHRSIGRVRRGTAAGFSLVEVMISVGIMTAIMAATMTALAQAMKANETAVLVTGMNNNLRTGMDLMIRDLLQVGSGLPPGHFILIPSGAGERINMPGPPGTAHLSTVGDAEINAVNPGADWSARQPVAGTACTVDGPGCVRTDTITTLAADSTFTDIALTARTRRTGRPSPCTRCRQHRSTGPDRVVPGQLIMLERGCVYGAVAGDGVDARSDMITFAANDSLNLNSTPRRLDRHGVERPSRRPSGFVPVAPATVLSTTATRIRMISYYIDNTNPAHPTLVRRINNGHPTDFDNTAAARWRSISTICRSPTTSRTATAILRTSRHRRLRPERCLPPDACSVNQIRKVNITLSARSRTEFSATNQYFRNTLSTQVSLRGMSFVNDYVQ